MTQRVKVFLDVDGVLNAVTTKRVPCADWDDWKVTKCDGWPINHSVQMGAALRALDADFSWLTTWGVEANEFIRPLFGWSEFPVLAVPPFEWWKFEAMQLVYDADPSPFIWVDDDLSYERDAMDWTVDNGGLVISPATRQGLTKNEIEAMAAYIRKAC